MGSNKKIHSRIAPTACKVEMWKSGEVMKRTTSLKEKKSGAGCGQKKNRTKINTICPFRKCIICLLLP